MHSAMIIKKLPTCDMEIWVIGTYMYHIFLAVCQWKNFENQLAVDWVITKKWYRYFCASQCISSMMLIYVILDRDNAVIMHKQILGCIISLSLDIVPQGLVVDKKVPGKPAKQQLFLVNVL